MVIAFTEECNFNNNRRQACLIYVESKLKFHQKEKNKRDYSLE